MVAWLPRYKSLAERTSLTAPIAPGESIIAPRTDSSASRFCGGTGAASASWATWATCLVKTPRQERDLQRKEHAFAHDPQEIGRHPQAEESCPGRDFSLGAGSSCSPPQTCGGRCG